MKQRTTLRYRFTWAAIHAVERFVAALCDIADGLTVIASLTMYHPWLGMRLRCIVLRWQTNYAKKHRRIW